MRNALAYVTRGQHTMAAAAIRQAVIQPDHGSAAQTWRHVAEWPKLGAFMGDAEPLPAWRSPPSTAPGCTAQDR